jgi:hypothetical protein
MISGFAAGPLFWGAVLGATAVLMWWHDHHMQRLTAWFFGASAACFTLAIPAVLGALAALTTTPGGLTYLALIDVVVFLAFYLQAIRTHKKSRAGKLFGRKGAGRPLGGGGPQGALAPVTRPNRYKDTLTPLVSILAGAFGVVTFGAWRILAAHASATALGTITALGRSAERVNNGTAAQAIPHSQLPATYLKLAAGFLVLALIMHVARKRKGKHPGASQRRGGMPVMEARSR